VGAVEGGSSRGGAVILSKALHRMVQGGAKNLLCGLVPYQLQTLRPSADGLRVTPGVETPAQNIELREHPSREPGVPK
jgi:hypothetical protein